MRCFDGLGVGGYLSIVFVLSVSLNTCFLIFLHQRAPPPPPPTHHQPYIHIHTFTCLSRLLACLDIYPNINRIKNVRCPVMVIHGKLDEEVPFLHGLELHNNVRGDLQREPWWVTDRGHNDVTEGPGKIAEYIRRLRTYLEGLDEQSQQPQQS